MRNIRTEAEIISNWKGSIYKPVVSVCCTTFNHETYIEDALRGFLIQETDFPFEIIVHDDASSDKTSEIVRDFAVAYPKIIKIILQTENQFSMDVHLPFKNTLGAAKGEFIALCEGDDFWLDKLKLFKQVRCFQDSDVYMVYTGATVYDSIRNPIGVRNLANQILTLSYAPIDVMRIGAGFYPTASSIFRKETFDEIPAWFYEHTTGDLPLAILAAIRGKIVCLPEVTVGYTVHPGGVSNKILLGEEGVAKNLIRLNQHKIFLEKIHDADLIDETEFEWLSFKELYMFHAKNLIVGINRGIFKYIFFSSAPLIFKLKLAVRFIKKIFK